MNKKSIIILICCVIILIAGLVYYFKFTFSGEETLYNIFGGNNLHLANNETEIYWFDARHSNSSSDPMFAKIEKPFTDFSPDLVLVEGGFNTFEGDRVAAIYEGESAFAAYLAKKNEILVEDIEPPLDKQIEYLQSKYQAENILAMYIIRQVCSELFAPDNSQWDFSQSLINIAQSLKDNGLDYDCVELDNILNTINKFLPEAVSTANYRDIDIKKMSYIYQRDGGILNPIYNDIYSYRNTYLVELIKEKKSIYDKIFIVMGGSHLADTKEELVKLYSN